MPTTRKKVIKTVYKDEDSEEETGDFSDSGSDAHISEPPSSDDEVIEENISSAEEFDSNSGKNLRKQPVKRKPKFAKEFISKINKQISAENEDTELPLSQFSVKDLSDTDKLLPSVLNLSESDSSDDEAPRASNKKPSIPNPILEEGESENEETREYTNIWANTTHDNSAEIAKKTFMELEQHKNNIEKTKASLQAYVPRSSVEQEKESNVTDLLALGEEIVPQKSPGKKKKKSKKVKGDSDSEVEDWEEVNESKAIPQQGIQLVVALPDYVSKKTKKIDVEMMMKRKMNKVKKEHQVFMHKVHVLCWIGHGNYVSPVLNDQEILAVVLAMVPKGCYPEDRLNMKYIEQITTWYKDKLTLKKDKHENKFRPKAPPLKNILLDQIKSRTVTSEKYFVYIFVAMLRALGLQCRIMFNFLTVPLKPPSSELCCLSKKPKVENNQKHKITKPKSKTTDSKAKTKSEKKIPQIDGVFDSSSSCCDSEFENIMQVDGNDDIPTTRPIRATRAKKAETANARNVTEDEGVSPPKRSKKETEHIKPSPRNHISKGTGDVKNEIKNIDKNKVLDTLKSSKTLSLKKAVNNENTPESIQDKQSQKTASPRKTRNNNKTISQAHKTTTSNKNYKKSQSEKELVLPEKETISQANKTINPKKNYKKSQNEKESVLPERETISQANKTNTSNKNLKKSQNEKVLVLPEIIVTNTDNDQKEITESKYFTGPKTGKESITRRSTRKRSHTSTANGNQNLEENQKDNKAKTRAKSVPGNAPEKSKYFNKPENNNKKQKLNTQQLKKQVEMEDAQRVSHKDLIKSKVKPRNNVTEDLVNIIKGRIKGAKEEAKRDIVKGKLKQESDDDSDYLPVEDPKHSESDEDFKPTKISPKAPKLVASRPSTSKVQLDRRVLSSDDDVTRKNAVDVWCEVFVEELEQWIAVDVIKAKVHCTDELYSKATHPVCYIVGWDNANYLKDLTRRYVPHWNTVTRKQRAEPEWWKTAIQPWLGPRNARDREEDEALDRMQLDAPLPKSIGEYKNHPLYALKRHLLKYEALYPPDAATLGFVRNEAVYSRDCVYTCRSREIWLREAKVVKMGEKPYKIVKARPKWDRLSNKCITDKPLEIFGPWQVQDYEPPTAVNGVVPRNAYGNVELFKESMLPKGTVHIKLPSLNKVARKLNIDCAPAMVGFDYTGGYPHPAYDGFVVCKEFEEIITEAWVKDQEEQQRKELEKYELRVYGNWKRLIKGLLIRERLKNKYGFEKPETSQASKNKKGPRLVVKKKS